MYCTCTCVAGRGVLWRGGCSRGVFPNQSGALPQAPPEAPSGHQTVTRARSRYSKDEIEDRMGDHLIKGMTSYYNWLRGQPQWAYPRQAQGKSLPVIALLFSQGPSSSCPSQKAKHRTRLFCRSTSKKKTP